MNRFVMSTSRLIVAALGSALFGLAACEPAQPPLSEGALYGSDIGGPFTLVNSEGEMVQSSDFDGKWRMIYFGYAYCPDVCPFDVQRMVAGHAKFADDNPGLAANVQPIFITVDPERDTPEVIGEFTRNFSEDLVGLTGNPEQIEAAAKAFFVHYSKGEVSESGGYLMDHSNAAYLLDPQGIAIALLPVDTSADAVAAELAVWVR